MSKRPSPAVRTIGDDAPPVAASLAEAGRRRSLGRGLGALMNEMQGAGAPEGRGQPDAEGVREIAVGAIAPHPEQPRRQFDEAALDELAASIAQRGVIQPIVVRPLGEGRYQLVAGERRWRAAQRARLAVIPALVRVLDDAETLAVALIENIQREDLNPVEEAEAYQRLIDQFGHSQADLARLVDKSRSHVANLLRLLALPEAVRAMVRDGRLSMGHARALITAADPGQLAEQVLVRGLSVRETEALARHAAVDGGRPRDRRGPAPDKTGELADLADVERHLEDLLGLRVQIKAKGAGAGSVTVQFASTAQLDLICERLSGPLSGRRTAGVPAAVAD